MYVVVRPFSRRRPDPGRGLDEGALCSAIPAPALRGVSLEIMGQNRRACLVLVSLGVILTQKGVITQFKAIIHHPTPPPIDKQSCSSDFYGARFLRVNYAGPLAAVNYALFTRFFHVNYSLGV